MYDIGNRIKELRIKRGYTQKMLGIKINKSKATISSYENDLQLPPLEVAIDIASILNVSLDYLVGLSPDERISTKGLSSEERGLIELIHTEFLKKSNTTQELTVDQIRIIQKLILLFQKQSVKHPNE